MSSIPEIIQNNIKFKIIQDDLTITNLSDDITSKLRSEQIATLASELSSSEEVRNALFGIQRSFYTKKGLIADGRDMGTVVFQDAKLKIFLTASPEIRAKRRYKQLIDSGEKSIYPKILKEIKLFIF